MQVLLEHLPHEVFVDPFEVAEAGRFGGNISRVVSRHDVDLEVCVGGGGLRCNNIKLCKY